MLYEDHRCGVRLSDASESDEGVDAFRFFFLRDR
jgi:hypothetical protein